MEDIDGGLHPAVDGQSLDDWWDERWETWNKRTNKILIYWSVPRDTRNRKPDPTHWSFGCSHSHTSPTRESCQTQTSFYFLFQPSPELPFVFHGCVDSDTSALLLFASTTRKDEIYDQVVGSLSGQVFQSGCHQFASSWNIVDTHTKWPPICLQSVNGWLASDDWVTSLRCRLG